MSEKKTYRLNETENKLATNVDGYVSFDLNHKTKKLVDDKQLKYFDVQKQYKKDRLNTNKFRFIVNIEPILINTLQNITGKDSLCVFNEDKFINSGFGFREQHKYITYSVKPNNADYATTSKKLSIDADFIDATNTVFSLDITSSEGILKIKSVEEAGYEYICWKRDGFILGNDNGTTVYTEEEIEAKDYTLSADTNFIAYYKDVTSNINNEISIKSIFHESITTSYPEYYTYYLDCEFPVGSDITVTGLTLTGTSLTPINVLSTIPVASILIATNCFKQEIYNFSTTNKYDGWSTFALDKNSDTKYDYTTGSTIT